MQWLSSIQEAATSAVSSITETLEAEKKEFLQEYNTTIGQGGTGASGKAAQLTSTPAAASSTADGEDANSLQNLRKVGWAMLNPLEDPDSLKPDEVRARMRALSQEQAVFLSPPPAEDFSFEFKMESSLSLVLEALSVDKHLEKQRHLLVPKQVSEFDFFKNYFGHLHALAQGALPVSAAASESGSSAQVSVHAPTSDATSEPYEVQASASYSATPLEDQFECVANACLSEEMLASAMASNATTRRDGISPVGDGRSETESPELAVDASQLTNSWEEELRAELAAME